MTMRQIENTECYYYPWNYAPTKYFMICANCSSCSLLYGNIIRDWWDNISYLTTSFRVIGTFISCDVYIVSGIILNNSIKFSKNIAGLNKNTHQKCICKSSSQVCNGMQKFHVKHPKYVNQYIQVLKVHEIKKALLLTKETRSAHKEIEISASVLVHFFVAEQKQSFKYTRIPIIF